MKFSFIKSSPNLQFVPIKGDGIEQVEGRTRH